jgi:anti-sigma regulatory factor (Ser/Thr protein kinase)
LAQSITVHKDLNAAAIFADKNLLQVVLRNLLSNAIRHIPAGGIVNLTIETSGKDMLIMVQDNGNGIDEETLRSLFIKQEHTSVARKGGGLGLLLVQEFVEQMSGSIKAENVSSGGAKFTIVLYNAAIEGSIQSESQPFFLSQNKFTEEEKKKMNALISKIEKYEIFDTTELRECFDAFDAVDSIAMDKKFIACCLSCKQRAI